MKQFSTVALAVACLSTSVQAVEPSPRVNVIAAAFAGCGPDGFPAVRIDLRWPRHAVALLLAGDALRQARQGQHVVELATGAVYACFDGECAFLSGRIEFAAMAGQSGGAISGEAFWTAEGNETSLPFMATLTGSSDGCAARPTLTTLRSVKAVFDQESK